MTERTYIFEATEYIITGREALKSLPSGKSKKLVEIRPVYVTDPTDKTSNKWVDPVLLFHVVGDEY